MSHSILSIRINSDDKKEFENFCENVGMNISVAINMFVKTVIREQKLPFEINNDSFYSSNNPKRLEKSIDQLECGNGEEHELIIKCISCKD